MSRKLGAIQILDSLVGALINQTGLYIKQQYRNLRRSTGSEPVSDRDLWLIGAYAVIKVLYQDGQTYPQPKSDFLNRLLENLEEWLAEQARRP